MTTIIHSKFHKISRIDIEYYRYPQNNTPIIPIETKQSLVFETSELLKFYQNARRDELRPNNELEDSLDNFIMYVKSLKNKFLEDLILNEMQIITNEKRKENLTNKYQLINKSVEESQELSFISNQVLAHDSNFEEMKELEKEVDKVITEEENLLNIAKDDKHPFQTDTLDLGNSRKPDESFFKSQKENTQNVIPLHPASNTSSINDKTQNVVPLEPASKLSSFGDKSQNVIPLHPASKLSSIRDYKKLDSSINPSKQSISNLVSRQASFANPVLNKKSNSKSPDQQLEEPKKQISFDLSQEASNRPTNSSQIQSDQRKSRNIKSHTMKSESRTPNSKNRPDKIPVVPSDKK